MSKKGSKSISKAEEKLKAKLEARTQETYPTETRKPEKPDFGSIDWIKTEPQNPIEYVRFQSPCPPANKMEPVYELKTINDDRRYRVDEIWEWQDKIYWTLNKQMSWSPLANVQYARPLCKI